MASIWKPVVYIVFYPVYENKLYFPYTLELKVYFSDSMLPVHIVLDMNLILAAKSQKLWQVLPSVKFSLNQKYLCVICVLIPLSTANLNRGWIVVVQYCSGELLHSNCTSWGYTCIVKMQKNKSLHVLWIQMQVYPL